MKTPTTLIQLLQTQVKERPNTPLYVFLKNGETEDSVMTFSQLDQRARAIAVMLEKAGARGERALLCYPPGIEYISAFFGCLYAGVIAVPSYPPNPSQLNESFLRLKPILANARAKFILTTNQMALLGRFLPGKPSEMKGIEWLSTDRAKDSWATDWREPDLNENSIAFLQYTSGSTGNPKGVMVSHTNLLHNLGSVEKLLSISSEDRAVIWLPPYHDLGLIGGILQPLFSGFTCYLMSPLDFLKRPARWLEAMSKYRGTISGGPGFGYDLCAKKITAAEKQKYDLSSWRAAFIGAEPIRASTLENFFEAMKPCGFKMESFYPTYGMAEGTLAVSGPKGSQIPLIANLKAEQVENNLVVAVDPGISTDSQKVRTFVGCGKSLPDQVIVVVNRETQKLCNKNEIGELWLSGPSVTQGYWENPSATAEAFHGIIPGHTERYLKTGDYGFVDESGEVFVTGRVKDLIIIRGKNFYPQDIESSALQSHPSIRPGGTVAFSIDTKTSNTNATLSSEELVIVTELVRSYEMKKDKDQAGLKLIADSIRKSIFQEHEVRVSRVVLILAGALPKTSSGKLQRAEARQKFLKNTLPYVYQWVEGEQSESAPDHVFEKWVMQELSKEAGVPLAEINLDSRLGQDLAMDSLMLVNLYSTMTAYFPQVNLDEVTKDFTVSNLIRVLNLQGITQPTELKLIPKEVPESSYRIDLFPEYLALADRFKMISDAHGTNPYFKSHIGASRDVLMLSETHQSMINYSGYNYVGMSGDPRVTEASKKAIDQFGTSVSASRLASGEIPLHQELEKEISSFLGAEDAVVFVAGHPTNVTTIGHVVGPGDLILHDALSHDSILQGAKLSGAQRRSFPHNDFETLDQILTSLRPLYRRVLIVIEAVYSMDGDIAPLPEFIKLKKKHKTFLFVDEAHSIGVLGNTGRGITEHFKVSANEIDFLMGTHSKALASCGGYIAGSKSMIQFLKYTAPGFVYSVGLPPSNAAAALEALKVLKQEPGRVTQLRENSNLFLSLSKSAGLDTGPSEGTPIIPVIVGDSVKCLRLANRLNERGINVQPILYPAVPESSTRLRFFITSCHSPEQIIKTVETIAEEYNKLNS